jgi:hypothetical protein
MKAVIIDEWGGAPAVRDIPVTAVPVLLARGADDVVTT